MQIPLAKTARYFFVSCIIILVCVLLLQKDIYGMGLWSCQRQPITEGQGLYRFSKNEIIKFLESLGYSEDFASHISRNSDGTALRFFSWKDNKALILSCDGNIKELDLRGYRAWLNDEGSIVAWSDRGIISFANGVTRKGILNKDSADVSGQYFLEQSSWNPEQSIVEPTKIYSFEKPEIPLATIKMKGSNARVFVNDNKVILIGMPPDKRSSLIVYIFQKQGTKLEKINEIEIVRPRVAPTTFYALDLSPWANNILIVDSRDFPFRSEWYEFDIDSLVLKAIGKASGYGFYLQCDVLSKAKKSIRK